MVFILLPAYNEEEGIEKLLERIRRISETFIPEYKVIIVNDGSHDHTLQVIECYKKVLNIEVVSFPKNQGVTSVFQTGFRKVCAEGADNDICITMDSDNTQNPFVILDIIKKMESSYDIVIASRFAEGGKMVGAPWFRNLLSKGVAFAMRQIANIPGVRDYSTFYRGVRVRVLKEGFKKYGDELISGHGFSGMAGLLVKLSEFTGKVTEVPLILRYDLKEGGSGMRIFKTIRGYLILMSNIIKNKR
jgi:dolichol-phosphate mannosyltransferase